MSECVEVQLRPRRYVIEIDHDLLKRAGERIIHFISNQKKVALITSKGIPTSYCTTLQKSLHSCGMEVVTFFLPDGEEAKEWNAIGKILSEMARANLDRSSLVIALGGGAIGDAAGLIASLFMRGLKLVQIPTTLLAMVDSSVGGKTGVNLPEGKNLVGTFHQPSLVLIDPGLLGTLPARELNASVAEIIKYGVIKDAKLFDQIAQGKPKDWSSMIKRCCEIKARIVEEDEFEQKNIRALLNFGHTIGHAIEAAAGYGIFLHGEAISLGMVGAVFLSQQKAGLSSQDAQAIIKAFKIHQLPITDPSLDIEKILKILQRDKKFYNNQIRFVLARKIGDAFVSDAVVWNDIQAALEFCKQRA